MAFHKIPWTEEPGRLQSAGLQRVRHNLATVHTLFMEPRYIFFHKEALQVKLQWAGRYSPFITKARTD